MPHKNAITEARDRLHAIELQTEFFTQDGIGDDVAKLTLAQIDILAEQALAKLDALIEALSAYPTNEHQRAKIIDEAIGDKDE